MKKRFFLIVLLFNVLALSAQKEHVKFMGIDMNCDVNTFKEKLIQKGFNYVQVMEDSKDKELVFEGEFSGEKAGVFVYYDESSKIVYKISVGIICMDKQTAEEKYNYFKQGLSVKYANHFYQEDTNIEKGKTFTVLLLDKDKKSYGGISMYIHRNFAPDLPDASILSIGYVDSGNTDKHNEKKYEDL